MRGEIQDVKTVKNVLKLAKEYKSKKKQIEDKIAWALKQDSKYEKDRVLREIRIML